jgi:hypothetical protein
MESNELLIITDINISGHSPKALSKMYSFIRRIVNSIVYLQPSLYISTNMLIFMVMCIKGSRGTTMHYSEHHVVIENTRTRIYLCVCVHDIPDHDTILVDISCYSAKWVTVRNPPGSLSSRF